MKSLRYILLLILVITAGCVKDAVYEGASTIKSVKLTPAAPTSTDNVVVTAVIAPGLQAPSTVTLVYNAGAGNQTVAMTGKDNTFTGTIPAQADKTKVTYKVTVVNTAGFSTVKESSYVVGDKPSDYTKLVLNELYGAGADAQKFIELYNNGDTPIKLKDVTIKKDEELTWTGIEGEVVAPHSHFAIVGAKGTTPRGFSSGFSSKKNVLIELYSPEGTKLNTFQRGEKGDGWGKVSLAAVTKSWSRCPDGTGKFMQADPTQGKVNPATGTEDETVKQ